MNGTIARFEMSYAPPEKGDRIAFGPPMLQRLPSLVYLAACLVIVGFVAWAHTTASSSRLHDWIIVGDEQRPLGSLELALVLLASGLGVVARTHLRGVVVTAGGVDNNAVIAPTWVGIAGTWVDPANCAANGGGETGET